MDSLAQDFERRFQEEFPEYSGNVRFLETLPKDLPQANMGPLARLKDLFRVKAQSPDILLFNRLRRDLSTLPAEHLQTLCEHVIEGRFGMYLFSQRETPRNFFRFEDPETAAPPSALCVVIGPDRSRTINDLLSCTALNQTGMDFPKLLNRSAADLLPGLFRFVYDHEIGHVLHNFHERKPSQAHHRNQEDTKEPACESTRSNDLYRTNFRERVADVYAAFRAAAAGTPEAVRAVALSRTLDLRDGLKVAHYTTPALEAAMRELKDGRAPDTPRAMFARALTLARETPLRTEEIQKILKPNLPVLK